MNRSIIALAAALTAGPAFADSPEYPPGLFEHSPVVPSGPSNGAPAAPPDAAAFWTPRRPAGCSRSFWTPRCRRSFWIAGRRRPASTTFALASNSGLSAVWLKSGRRTLGAIRRRIDRAGVIADRGCDRDPHRRHANRQARLEPVSGVNTQSVGPVSTLSGHCWRCKRSRILTKRLSSEIGGLLSSTPAAGRPP